MTIDEIREYILNKNSYFDSDYFIHLLEDFFKCNIYIFSSKSGDGYLKIPRHVQNYLTLEIPILEIS